MIHEYFREVSDRKLDYIDLRELYSMLRNSVSRVDIVKVNVRDACGHVLAEEIKAIYDRPPYDISHSDGFAVKHDNLVHASKYSPIKLRIVSSVNPRRANEYELKSGEAVFVETGYPLPVNADVVIPIEEVVIDGEYIVVDKPYSKYFHVFRKSSDFKINDVVLKFGTRITPIAQKVLIDLGYEYVRVYRKPRVALLNIGDELYDGVYRPDTDKIPASTTWINKHTLEYYGADIVKVDYLPDNPEAIVKTIKELVDNVDLIITTGGVSLGPRDYAWLSLFREIKPNTWWRGVKILPGRATSGMVTNGKLILNQPGLPQSSVISLMFIAVPVLEYVQGLDLKLVLNCTEVCLAEDLVFTKFIDFYRVFFLNTIDNRAYPVKNLGTYYLNPLIQSNSFTIMDPGYERIREGSVIKACFYPPLFQPIRSEIRL